MSIEYLFDDDDTKIILITDGDNAHHLDVDMGGTLRTSFNGTGSFVNYINSTGCKELIVCEITATGNLVITSTGANILLSAPVGYISTDADIIPTTSGTIDLGSSQNYWGTIYANQVIQTGLAASSISTPSATNNSGIATWSGTSGGGFRNSTLLISASNDLIPSTSGSSNIGTIESPFSSVYANNYRTTRVSGAVTTATTTIDWSQGSSQILTWANGQPSGTTVLLSGATAGSSYVLETVNNASGTSRITWPSNIKWPSLLSGTTTASNGALDLFTFYYNGSSFFGNVGQNFR